MNRTRGIVCLLAVALLAASAGCVLKSIAVRSDPPGATVYLDGEEVGRTPVHGIPWFFDGTREIVVAKEGYLTERRTVEMSASWFSWFPLDVVSELLIPWDIYDRRYYYFALKPMVPVGVPTLMRHAADTRSVARERIEGARRSAKYRPPAYVIKGEPKKSILVGPFSSPPRTKPIYEGEDEPKPEPKPKSEPKPGESK